MPNKGEHQEYKTLTFNKLYMLQLLPEQATFKKARSRFISMCNQQGYVPLNPKVEIEVVHGSYKVTKTLVVTAYCTYVGIIAKKMKVFNGPVDFISIKPIKCLPTLLTTK